VVVDVTEAVMGKNLELMVGKVEEAVVEVAEAVEDVVVEIAKAMVKKE
jgi:hypothetical protein